MNSLEIHLSVKSRRNLSWDRLKIEGGFKTKGRRFKKLTISTSYSSNCGTCLKRTRITITIVRIRALNLNVIATGVVEGATAATITRRCLQDVLIARVLQYRS